MLTLVADTDIAELDVTVAGTRCHLKRSPVSAPPGRRVGCQPVDRRSHRPWPSRRRRSASSVRPSPPAKRVQSGQSMGAIEALGMPTSVEAPHSGIVEELLVQDGSPVEYGQPLLVLRRG